eukprot:CAMPEP_0113439652 /NCGR_PEP_ID=MMETSP0014_2-20120614/149_1 /TAXON_ID=2857 /ORGANISM="Nitzschia sp." /LENGTH=1262 /DNA_ID=CAMNT_0000330415 /DNA_START=69 /DNA_END=3857 /DNA_ORIENTATION=+ /assembly_acc=CAM_ASM_000159
MDNDHRKRTKTRPRTRSRVDIEEYLNNGRDSNNNPSDRTTTCGYFGRIPPAASAKVVMTIMGDIDIEGDDNDFNSSLESPPTKIQQRCGRSSDMFTVNSKKKKKIMRIHRNRKMISYLLPVLCWAVLQQQSESKIHVECFHCTASIVRSAPSTNVIVKRGITTSRENCNSSGRIRLHHLHHHHYHNPDNQSIDENESSSIQQQELLSSSSSRRSFLQNSAIAAAAVGVSVQQTSTTAAWAGVAELDKSTGSLYTPKKEMLSGGSAAARGIRNSDSSRPKLQPGQALQQVYETRFITYLSRFLINFDPAANAWWVKNALNGGGISMSSSSSSRPTKDQLDLKFAEFAESVEIGLADYFVGPYGSYSSLSAMKAGLNANGSVRSLSPDGDDSSASQYFDTDRGRNGDGWTILGNLFGKSKERIPLSSTTKKLREKRARKSQAERESIAQQGVLNLYTLLKARYQSRTAKRQLAILFSFFSNPNIQPTAEIKSLLGEVDNCTISQLDLVQPSLPESVSNSKGGQMRISIRVGGGYSYDSTPTVKIDPPPALGAAYEYAKAMPIMKRTSRILKVKVVDRGSGYYNKPPEVLIDSPGGIGSQPCQACAILDRNGGIESIVVLDPGFGYGQGNGRPPAVKIRPPEYRGIKDSGRNRPAVAKAYLEYEVAGIQMSRRGNGYVATEPPKVTLSPPKEVPDWFVERPTFSSVIPTIETLSVQVTEMLGPKGNVVYASETVQQPPVKLPLQRVRDNPAELLPSAVRPILNSYGTYVIPDIAAIRTYDDIMDNPRFRAVDPLFGAIGAIPAQKSANELKPSEYGRLALSGAICTVLVRTALNPLELIKTKQQLRNDEELFLFARESLQSAQSKLVEPTDGGMSESQSTTGTQGYQDHDISHDKTTSSESESILATATEVRNTTSGLVEEKDIGENEVVIKDDSKIGSMDLIVSLVKLRGPTSIFQSADITLLASLVFGSLGFGATEFYRRSFSMAFFSSDSGAPNQFKTELVLLLAATVATILTSAAAAPFELLRVRSMGLVERKEWTHVMKDFLKEKNSKAPASFKFEEIASESTSGLLPSKESRFREYAPLWAGFGPTASRELAFAIPKFLAFDIIAQTITAFINSQLLDEGALPVQVGVGSLGLLVSALSGALAGIAGAFVSHPADLILTYLSSTQSEGSNESDCENDDDDKTESEVDWKDVVKDLLSREGGIANLYVGLTPRLIFFFLVIGLQFFLYDYVKNLLEVGSDDLSLVLDVFFAVRQGLVDSA